jgi:hypothetical protein
VTDASPDPSLEGGDGSTLGCFAEGTEGDMTQCVVDSVFSAGPAPGLMGLVMGATVLSSLYVAGDGSISVPAVVTILLGAVLIPVLPAQFETLAYTVVVIGVATAIFAAYTRFTHRGGF